MTPVHHARNDQLIDVAQNFVEGLTVVRRLHGKRGENRSGFFAGRDTNLFDVLSKIRNPIRERVQLPAKLFRRRVAQVARLAVGMFLHGLDFR